ncbi:MAG: DUF5320 domain-containing protein [Anaerolineae bacterium]|nr:DUF5320 domain-containing protein [Anaerolineae bacterium]
MPARDGTGPLGQGARTGRRMGNCDAVGQGANPSLTPERWRPSGWGSRLWGATVGRFWNRRRGRRVNRNG